MADEAQYPLNGRPRGEGISQRTNEETPHSLNVTICAPNAFILVGSSLTLRYGRSRSRNEHRNSNRGDRSRSNDEPRVGTKNVCRHCIPRVPPQGRSRDGRPEGEGVGGALRMNVRTDTHRAFQDNRYPESSSDSDSDTSSSSSSASSSSASSRDYGIRSRNESRYGRRS